MLAEHPSSKIPPNLVQLLHEAAKENASPMHFRKDAHHATTLIEKPHIELAAAAKTETPLIDFAGIPVNPKTPE